MFKTDFFTRRESAFSILYNPIAQFKSTPETDSWVEITSGHTFLKYFDR